jgi:hypothetical protein
MVKFLCLALFFFTVTGFGQKPSENRQPLKQLATVGRLILESPEYAIRDSANRVFTDLLEAYAITNEGYQNPMAEVTNMLRLTPRKGKFCIYTWQMPDSAFHYVRYGLVVVKTKRKGYVSTRLTDKLSTLSDIDFKTYKADEWPGAIYYKLLPDGHTKDFYTLLGFAQGEPLNRKIVEVIEVRDNGKVRFGGKIFKVDEYMDKTLRSPPMRLIFSYNAKYSVTVNWNEKEDKVIMDHLAPADVKLKGVYQTYGPDFSYDALYWKNDWWYLQSNIQFNSGQNNLIVPPNKPTGLPKR